MHISITHTTSEGQQVSLTLSCADLTPQQEADLDTGQARARINLVLDREVKRIGEIMTVAMQDAHQARRLEQVRRQQKREGKVPPRGPDQILGAGNKDPETGRLIVHPKTQQRMRPSEYKE